MRRGGERINKIVDDLDDIQNKIFWCEEQAQKAQIKIDRTTAYKQAMEKKIIELKNRFKEKWSMEVDK